MTKREGCNYEGKFYNVGESDPSNEFIKGICGKCQGRGLFEHALVIEHNECLPPFDVLEFEDNGITYKYCLYGSSFFSRTCDAERECIKLDSFLATLDEFPDRKYWTNVYNLTGRGRFSNFRLIYFSDILFYRLWNISIRNQALLRQRFFSTRRTRWT